VHQAARQPPTATILPACTSRPCMLVLSSRCTRASCWPAVDPAPPRWRRGCADLPLGRWRGARRRTSTPSACRRRSGHEQALCAAPSATAEAAAGSATTSLLPHAGSARCALGVVERELGGGRVRPRCPRRGRCATPRSLERHPPSTRRRAASRHGGRRGVDRARRGRG
jgi:hypothetical protein